MKARLMQTMPGARGQKNPARTVNATIQITQFATPLLFSWRRAIASFQVTRSEPLSRVFRREGNRMRVHIASGMP